ncbi:MAG: hypothetical protein LW596_01565 [Ilumatobacteraceae bacterium]|nr:hypothetical protein [Ilumatobacteraceae bacterium]
MKLRVSVVVAASTMLMACGGGTGSPRDGVHSHGGDDAFNVSLVEKNVIADVTVDPARVGDVIIHMELAPPGGKLQQVEFVSGTLTPSDPAQSSVELKFEKSGANHFHHDVSVPSAGDWTLSFNAVLEDGTSLPYTTTVTFDS